MNAEAALDELWRMAWRYRAISPTQLTELLPIALPAAKDERSRMLIRDAMNALRDRNQDAALRSHPDYALLEAIRTTEFDKVGFRTLGSRLMEPTTPAQIERFFRELGRRVRTHTVLYVAGSAVLLANRLIVRHTTYVDVINEIPASIREDHEIIDTVERATQLRLAHTASHYYPKGWRNRTSSYGVFDLLDVRFIDPIDQLVGKLFSKRDRDAQDVKDAWDGIDQNAFRDRLQRTTHELRQVERVQSNALETWYILTGEKDLPPLIDSPP